MRALKLTPTEYKLEAHAHIDNMDTEGVVLEMNVGTDGSFAFDIGAREAEAMGKWFTELAKVIRKREKRAREESNS